MSTNLTPLCTPTNDKVTRSPPRTPPRERNPSCNTTLLYGVTNGNILAQLSEPITPNHPRSKPLCPDAPVKKRQREDDLVYMFGDFSVTYPSTKKW